MRRLIGGASVRCPWMRYQYIEHRLVLAYVLMGRKCRPDEHLGPSQTRREAFCLSSRHCVSRGRVGEVKNDVGATKFPAGRTSARK